MKVLLINPAWRRGRSGARRYARAWPPLDLLNAAALLRSRGHEPRLIDGRATRMSAGAIAAAAGDADLVLLQTSPLDRWQCPELDWRHIKEMVADLPHDRLVLAGAHGTLCPELILNHSGAAMLIRGEPEAPLASLADSNGRPDQVAGISYRTPSGIRHLPDQTPAALDVCPPPAYDLIDPGDYRYELLGRRLALIETSRGCPFSCRFCLKTMYGSGVRYKSPERVAEELAMIVFQWGARYVYFIDLEFTIRREAVLALCRKMEKMKLNISWCCQTRVDAVDFTLLKAMKTAGCRLIHFGIESGSRAVLDRCGKGIRLEQAFQAVSWCRQLGIDTALFFLFGLPGEGSEDRKATETLARSLNPTFASFHVAAPYPGTGYGQDNAGQDPFPACFGGEGEQAALATAARRAFARFYLRPRYLAARLTEGSLRDKLDRLGVFWGFVR